jgi:hypothetical protein
MHDVFICHASEDKADVARPLAERLSSAGLKVWYDEFSLTLGDSLRDSIDKGLIDSRFGIVILSPHFFSKRWPQTELNGLFTKEIISGGKMIIPIWHNITQAEVAQHSPILADRVAASTNMGFDIVLEKALDTIEPAWRHKSAKGLTVAVSPTSVRLHSGEWAVKTPVIITNKGQAPLHAIMVKICIHGDGVSASSLDVEANPQLPPLEETIGNIIVSADQLRMNCSNKEGKQIVLLMLHTVSAKGTRTLSIKGTTPVNSSAEISIADFDESPRELLTRAGKELAIMFKAPEDLILQGVGVKMRKRR